ncbi:MAG: peptidylprolyl isomerase [Woeseiaceae bacterium]|nr:peptidylprolyl isomerase [Woeseiaceae bacterium]
MQNWQSSCQTTRLRRRGRQSRLAWPGHVCAEFEEIANNSELGEVSEPFRSRFGWHILEVLDRRTYDNTEEVKENNCRERVQNSKLANESELWIRRLRDEAYVETRI